MWRAKLIIPFALVSVSTAHANFAEIPRYDVPKHCSELASLGGSHSNVLEESCFQQEQSEYNTLKLQWASLKPAIKKHCDSLARLGGHGSYVLLKACVDQEQQAGQSTKKFEY
ncbi:MAG: hypothetical protein ABJN04_15625 [Hyphomicrobiales bacterium]